MKRAVVADRGFQSRRMEKGSQSGRKHSPRRGIFAKGMPGPNSGSDAANIRFAPFIARILDRFALATGSMLTGCGRGTCQYRQSGHPLARFNAARAYDRQARLDVRIKRWGRH